MCLSVRKHISLRIAEKLLRSAFFKIYRFVNKLRLFRGAKLFKIDANIQVQVQVAAESTPMQCAL